MGKEEPNKDQPGEGTPPTGDGPGGQVPQKPEPVKFSPEQQTELDRIISERLTRAKEKWEADSAEAKRKAEQTAEAQRLAEQQEWKKLAEGHASRITELEAEQEKAKATAKDLERYQAALKSHLDTQREGLPEHILALLDRMDAVEQLEYLAANREALTGQRSGPSGVPASPRPRGEPGKISDEEKRQHAVSANRYW